MPNYSREFKDQIVELHQTGGRTFMDLAKEFDLSSTTVANWVREANKRNAAKGKTGKDEDGVESDKAKITRLERELARKTEELEILGKALAFFARRTDL
jgi:transposase